MIDMTNDDLEKISEMISSAFEEHHRKSGEASAFSGTLDRRLHSRHHDWIQQQIDKQIKNDELIEKLKHSVLGWIVVGIFIGGGTAIWEFIAHSLKNVK